MARRRGRRWASRSGGRYTTRKAATRSDRSRKVSPAAQAARRRTTARRMKGKRR